MAASGVGNLIFIDGIIDAKMYLNILKDNLLQTAEKLGVRDRFRFYQNHDPKHSAGMAKAWFVWKCPHVFITPVKSSDLNVIENLWEIAIRRRKNKIDLLMEEWQKVLVNEKTSQNCPGHTRAYKILAVNYK